MQKRKYAKQKLEKAQTVKYIRTIYRSQSQYKLNITVCKIHTFIAFPLYGVIHFYSWWEGWEGLLHTIAFMNVISSLQPRLQPFLLEFGAMAKAVWHDNVFVEVVRSHRAVSLHFVQDLMHGKYGRGRLPVRRAAFWAALIGETFTCKCGKWRESNTVHLGKVNG